MPVLTVLCGIPGSGKTTHSRLLADAGVKCVASDEYRRFITGHYGDSRHDGFVRGICRKVVEHYLRFGSDVCFDATNPTPESRAEWVAIAQSVGASARCVWVDADLATCLARIGTRENIVPTEVVTRIRDGFVPPDESEGFDEVIKIKG